MTKYRWIVHCNECKWRCTYYCNYPQVYKCFNCPSTSLTFEHFEEVTENYWGKN